MAQSSTTTLERTEQKPRVAKHWKTSPVSSHHHISFRCLDPEETRRYYEDFLGFEFTAAIPSKATVDGKSVDVLHMLFRMANGDFLGFYHTRDGEKAEPITLGPLDMHMAMKVPSEKDWDVWVKRLTDAGIHFEGPLDHDFVRSVYFQDPNGVWLEFAYQTEGHDEMLRDLETHAKEGMDGWTKQTATIKNTARGK